jgi:ubiquitin-protein ligase
MKVSLPTNDLSLWHVEFSGAKGTLYEGENFTLQLRFNNDYVISPIISAHRVTRSHLRQTHSYS